jgi:protein TonB
VLAPDASSGGRLRLDASGANGGSGGLGGDTASKETRGEGNAAGTWPAARAGEGRGRGAAGDGALALAIPDDGGGVYGAYLALLRRRVQEAVSYPPAARRRSLNGTVHLEISVDSTGDISEVIVVRSSSHAALDEAAMDGVRALRRVPFPPDVRPRALRVRLPVVFELR